MSYEFGPIQDLVDDVEATIAVGGVPYIEGPPGVGKTQMVHAIARKRGGFFALVIGSTAEPTDICGFPVVSTDSVEDAAGRQHHVLRFAPREMLVRLNREGGTIFFDELTCCTHDLQSALLTAICDWKFGDFQLDRRKVSIITAGNPAGIAVNGQELPGPMQNRLTHFTFPVSNETRFEWATRFPSYWGNPPVVGLEGALIPEEACLKARSYVAGYIRKNPDQWLDPRFDSTREESNRSSSTLSPAFPTPRSWERVSNHIAKCIADGKEPLRSIRRIEAEIGPGSSTSFLTYLREASLPDPEALLASPSTYEPSGRVDLDFTSMMSVAAAISANLKPDRYLAGWQILGRAVATKGGSQPAYEAGMAAARQLSQMFTGAKSVKLLEPIPLSQRNDFALKIVKLSKPFKELAAEISKSAGVEA